MSFQIQDSPFSQSAKFGGKNIHLGVSGSVACYKVAELLRSWLKMGIGVSATLSAGALHFITPTLIRALGADPVYGEMFEGGIFDHLEPGKKADCMAIVPASADIIAKLANGMADEMLCAQYIAFDKTCIIAPAMNPAMWRHPATQNNVRRLAGYGCQIVEPGVGGTACGDGGKGRLAELPEIFLACLKALSPSDLAGAKVMVTLGPTREPWDGARFWSNPSSGKMGAALATAAWLRGADVTAICGPLGNICFPDSVHRVNVMTASEMFGAAQDIWPRMDAGIFNAAVADFAPIRPDGGDEVKYKKNSAGDRLTVNFARTPDILSALAADRRAGQKIAGFAAEITENLEALLPLAKGKLHAKNADIIAANRINAGESAFGAADAGMAIVDKNGREEIWSTQCKADIAWDLLSWLLNM